MFKILITTTVHGELYSIQHYVINFVSDLRQVGGFSPGTPVSSTNKTDRHNIAEILLKVVLTSISLNLFKIQVNLSFIYSQLKLEAKKGSENCSDSV